MSFKDGIPLLTTLDDEDASDDDFSVELASTTRHRWGRKHLLFSLVLGLVVFLVLALIVGVTVPVVLLRGGGSKSTGSTGSSSSETNSSVPISPSVSSPPVLSSIPSLSASVPLPTSPSTPTTTSTISPSTPSQISPTPTPSPADELNQYKPTSDHREYDFLTLSNSLRVILISDPKSNVSAASMEVAAGSFSDPPNTEGLAHFCEHMLFLGTEKYPNDHEYSNYLQSHGGFDNAFTSTQETNYYFGVDSKYLEGALDRFAQFFISPLFRSTSVEDEVHAVNAEHEKNLQSDNWKLWQLLKHVSNPHHPFHQFSTGTLSTLNHTNLLELLKSYYNSNYSANTMRLVVYGKDPLPTLANWVTTYFTNITNRQVSPQTFPTTAFPPEFSGQLVFHYPVADTNTLNLFWQTAPLEPFYRNDVVEVISRYLGYEGPGSVLDRLKSQSLAVSLSVGTEVNADSFSLFLVNIELTEEGLGRVPEVVKTVFQFIRLLSTRSEAQMKELWENHVAVSQVVFDHSEPEQPNTYTTILSERMRYVQEAPDVLGNPRRLVFNYSLVDSVLASLTPENLVLFVGTHHVNFSSSLDPLGITPEGPPQQGSSAINLPWPDLDQLEPIYSTPYARRDIPSDVLTYWGDLADVPDELFLPGRNSFIPSNFDLLRPPSTPTDTPTRVNLTHSPVGSGVSLWWLQDTTFNTPHVNMYCSIDAAKPNTTSVRWSELSTLYAQMATEILTPVLYPAKELTYSMGLYASPSGLQLTFSGFSDPNIMRRYINTTVTYMKDFSKMREVFNVVREKRQDFLQNYKYQNLPYSYIFQYLQQVVMQRPFWKHEEELAVVNDVNLSPNDVIAHADTIFSDASFLCFTHGNIDQTTAGEYMGLVVNTLSPSPPTGPPPAGQYYRQRVSLRDPGSYSVTLPTLNPSDKNSAVNAVFQVGPACSLSNSTNNLSSCSEESLVTSAHLGLLSHIIGDQCFYQLRTVEQLGYVVFCFQATYYGATSFQTLVQSQEYNASYVLGEIDLFLQNFETSVVAKFTDETLDMNREQYARALRKKSQTLKDESDRLWSEVSNGREQFDYNSQLLGTLDTITPQSFLQFYRRHITDPAQHRKLVVGVYGADKPVDLSEQSTYCIDWDTLDHSLLEYSAANSNCTTSL